MKLIFLGMMVGGLSILGQAESEDVAEAPRERTPPALEDFQHCIPNSEELPYTAEVVVSFDVTPEGKVTNIRVLESTDSCFDKAAINAVTSWEYEPIYVDGKKFGRTNIKTTMKFEFGERL